MTVHPSPPAFPSSLYLLPRKEDGSVSQTPKWVDFAGSHRHSMAGTSGERGGEKRGNKREVQRDFFIYFLKGRGMLVRCLFFWKQLLWLVTKRHAEYSTIPILYR